MKWFGRKSAGRADARPVLARGWSSAPAVRPWTYEEGVRTGYAGNPIVQRAVRLIAEGVGSVPLTGAVPETLRLVRARTAGQGLLETLAMQLLLHGNGFVRVLGASAATPSTRSVPVEAASPVERGDLPTDLFALRPERVTVERDAQGWPVAYLYRAGERAQRIAAEDAAGRPALIHLRSAHPLDDHYGLGCLGAAAGAVAIHNAATRWNQALLDNAARPSGALVYDRGGDGEALAPEQFRRLREELDAQFAGAANAGRPLLLDGGLRWQAMSLTPADMDFVGLKSSAAREIALAFGVPPMLLGLPGDAAYANYKEANRALWRQAILPLAGLILGGLNEALARWWPDGAVRVDLDHVPALADEREALWRQVTAADFLSRAEKRKLLGVER